jgi:hypothetical protein
MNLSDLGRRAIYLPLLGLFILLLRVYAPTISAAGRYHLLKKVPLAATPGGGEYFDYITVVDFRCRSSDIRERYSGQSLAPSIWIDL